MTNPDTSNIYSGVVSIENVRILILIADLNNLEEVAADISNAYVIHSYMYIVHAIIMMESLTS